ncbi:hypothetical protein DVA79_20620, partial [Acinetobacter baumannii]
NLDPDADAPERCARGQGRDRCGPALRAYLAPLGRPMRAHRARPPLAGCDRGSHGCPPYFAKKEIKQRKNL